MLRHLAPALWLLVLTLLLCVVLYPLALWGYGQLFFPHQAEGSLVDADGNPVTSAEKARGSRLIGQPFKGDEYFQPRPSNAGDGYDASQSGASNWAASNPLLRSRVARQLGPIVRYAANSPTRPGKPVARDVEEWFQAQKPDYVARWAADNSTLAEQWVKDNAAAVAGWLKKPEDDVKNNSGDAATAFWKSYPAAHPGTWPTVDDNTKAIQPARDGADVQGFFFDPWLQAHREKLARGTMVLEQVPADMVMSSGSGLDPHITLKNALYQIDRVAGAWAKKFPDVKADRVNTAIKDLLESQASAPLGGLAGVPLVNVLEVNQALPGLMKKLAEQGR